MLADFRDAGAELAPRRPHGASRAPTSPPSPATASTVLVGANLGSVADARGRRSAAPTSPGWSAPSSCSSAARTAPDVDEQEAAYRAIAEALGGRRITLRTLDVGGDKPLAYLPMPAEANPFLGVRGHPARRWPARTLLADQLAAIVRVAHDHPVERHVPDGHARSTSCSRRARLLDDGDRAGRPRAPGRSCGSGSWSRCPPPR